MPNWTPAQQQSVKDFLDRMAGECDSCMSRARCDECWSRAARALLRSLAPSVLPPPVVSETERGGWIASRDRHARRRALVVQLLAAPGHRLRASEIKIPGITDRTALHKFLSRNVRSGFLRRIEKPSENGRFPVGYYVLRNPNKPI